MLALLLEYLSGITVLFVGHYFLIFILNNEAGLTIAFEIFSEFYNICSKF